MSILQTGTLNTPEGLSPKDMSGLQAAYVEALDVSQVRRLVDKITNAPSAGEIVYFTPLTQLCGLILQYRAIQLFACFQTISLM